LQGSMTRRSRRALQSAGIDVGSVEWKTYPIEGSVKDGSTERLD
jgi:hypothetical protein